MNSGIYLATKDPPLGSLTMGDSLPHLSATFNRAGSLHRAAVTQVAPKQAHSLCGVAGNNAVMTVILAITFLFLNKKNLVDNKLISPLIVD